jgi:YfiH family protein
VADSAVALFGCAADASVARSPGQVCAVMTADCLPLLLCDASGQAVAAVHAGWRGLVAGVVEQTVGVLGGDPGQILAWLGPAIGPDAFEVGGEVRDQFLAADPGAGAAFRAGVAGRWLADLYTLARGRLENVGVREVFGGGYCTYSDPGRFFSYRRAGVTGRMAGLIWLAQ